MNKFKAKQLKESVRREINKLKLKEFRIAGLWRDRTEPSPEELVTCDCQCDGAGLSFISHEGSPTQGGGCDCSGRTDYYNGFHDGRYDGMVCVAVRPTPYDRRTVDF